MKESALKLIRDGKIKVIEIEGAKKVDLCGLESIEVFKISRRLIVFIDKFEAKRSIDSQRSYRCVEKIRCR